MMKEWEELTEEDRKALRGSKFAPLPAPPSSSSRPPRFAHPGGPLATNKAAALAKFLERKLQEPDGLASINPALIEQAVKNAKETVNASGSSNSGRLIRHVTSFADAQEPGEEDEGESQVKVKDQKPKKHKKKKKNKKKKKMEDLETTRECRKPKKKLKL